MEVCGVVPVAAVYSAGMVAWRIRIDGPVLRTGM